MDDGGPTDGKSGFVKRGFSKIAGLIGRQTEGDVTESEIISMVNEGHEQGVLQASEAEMITNIFEFGDKEAHDIMVHRKNIIALDGNMTLQEALTFIIGENKSRYPVYDGDIDHIIGILHFKDAVRMREMGKSGVITERKIKSIKGLVREARFIPETRNIDVLFHNMRAMKIQMVIVIDEYGQTAGLVAMEDILEEIVGNIMDEYDEEEGHIREKGENEYVIEGLTPLKELEEQFGISFGEQDFETLNGFLISRMDRIPDDDEEFETDMGGWQFKVLSVKNRVIENVLVTKLPEEGETSGAE